MAMSIDDELRLDAEEDAREVQYIKNALPSELKDRFSTDDIYYLMDAIVEYYYDSGIFETDDDEVTIDLQAVAEHISKKVRQENAGNFTPDELFFVVQADLDYQEQNA